MREKTQIQFLGQEDPLEKEMATHSSILAWELVLSFLFQVLTECKLLQLLFLEFFQRQN